MQTRRRARAHEHNVITTKLPCQAHASGQSPTAHKPPHPPQSLSCTLGIHPFLPTAIMDLQSFLQHLIQNPILFLYQLMQWVLTKVLSPTPPPPNANLSRPKIAIIGAGLTGVSAASHCVGHGFDCTIFEAGDRKNLGGIWSVCFLLLTQKEHIR